VGGKAMHELDYSSGNSVQRVIRSARTATLRAAYDSPGVTFRSCRGPEMLTIRRPDARIWDIQTRAFVWEQPIVILEVTRGVKVTR